MPYADKEMKRLKDKEYREKHKDEIHLKFQKKYKKNKEAILLRNKKNYLKNREIILQKMREYYQLKKRVKQIDNILNILLKDDLKYEYSPDVCQKEFEKIKQIKGSFIAPANLNKIVLTNQPHYYEIEKQLWHENKNNLRQWLVNNRKKYIGKDEYKLTDKEILRSFKISGKYIGFTQFSPQWIKGFIEKYQVKAIYDPCMGWGHRLLGAYDIVYIGNDLDTRTYNGNMKIAQTYNLINKSFYNQDATLFTPIEKYDAVFTCPPYFNTEIYNNKSFENIEQFKIFWNNLIKKSLKLDVKLFAYVINHQYLELTKNICVYNGLKHVEDILLKMQYNHFQRVDKNSIKTEQIVIYKTNC